MRNYQKIVRVSLFMAGLLSLLLLFPKQGHFRYEFYKGKPWMHEDLIAPFDFAILKPEEVLEKEKEEVLRDVKPIFRKDETGTVTKRGELEMELNKWFRSGQFVQKGEVELQELRIRVLLVYDSIMGRGILENTPEIAAKQSEMPVLILLPGGATEAPVERLLTIRSADIFIRDLFRDLEPEFRDPAIRLVEQFIFQNLRYDESLNKKERAELLARISLSSGIMQHGERIISRGEILTPEKYQVLLSLKKSYDEKIGPGLLIPGVVAGQVIILGIALAALYFFLYLIRPDVFADNRNIFFILLTIVLMVVLISWLVKYQVSLLLIAPICLVPLLIRVFYDTRLALFVHLITIIITGFLVPNSFQFVFLQLFAGIITILSVIKLESRSQFFLTSFLIFISYSLIYTGMTLQAEGSLQGIKNVHFAHFGMSALLTLFSYPLIFLVEKVFGMVTDMSLMELTNTNRKLLRELSLKAPGTFQHSMQVANLAEQAIYEIGGDALLVRTGAMYHDIGKMDMPQYFIENQVTGYNPHDELTYEESAALIISHVQLGIEKARKYNLPEQVIDFIRTHHGTRRTEYFFQLQKKSEPDGEVNEQAFTYQGRLPFSRETAVLMMADSVEAASRSLTEPGEEQINTLVDRVIDGQVAMKQHDNSNITLRDIARVKRVMKRHLLNSYHIRITYPD